jgi:hypothetical protein
MVALDVTHEKKNNWEDKTQLPGVRIMIICWMYYGSLNGCSIKAFRFLKTITSARLAYSQLCWQGAESITSCHTITQYRQMAGNWSRTLHHSDSWNPSLVPIRSRLNPYHAFKTLYCYNHCNKEAEWLSRYSEWLRAGRQRGRSSSPGRGKNFLHSFTPVVAHPVSYPIGTGGLFPGGKAIGAWSWPLTSS